MRLTTYGTRGSIPISNPKSVKYGGNTTCIRIESECIPAGQWLVLDAGSGFVPLSGDALAAKTSQMNLLQTHHHHDHNQGMLLSPITFIKQIPFHVYGPMQDNWSPKQVFEAIMQKPLFPVPAKVVLSHFHFHKLEYPTTVVILVHPEGGFKLMDVDVFEKTIAKDAPLPFKGMRFPVGECLVIKMHRTEHPETTISYRVEERPTGKVAAVLTDHETQASVPMSLRAHLKDVDVLLQDCQYTPEEYYSGRTAGFGHGTPDFAATLAGIVGAKRLGLMHHDPKSTDQDVDAILAIAREEAGKNKKGIAPKSIFACADYMIIEV